MNLRELAPRFAKEAGHEKVPWGLAIATLKRLFTAFPWWEEKDVLRVAHMARIEEGGPVPLHHLSAKNARRLYELAAQTRGGRDYDPNESVEAVQLYRILRREE